MIHGNQEVAYIVQSGIQNWPTKESNFALAMKMSARWTLLWKYKLLFQSMCWPEELKMQTQLHYLLYNTMYHITLYSFNFHYIIVHRILIHYDKYPWYFGCIISFRIQCCSCFCIVHNDYFKKFVRIHKLIIQLNVIDGKNMLLYKDKNWCRSEPLPLCFLLKVQEILTWLNGKKNVV